MNLEFQKAFFDVYFKHKNQFSEEISFVEFIKVIEFQLYKIENIKQIPFIWFDLCEKRQFTGKTFDQLRKECTIH